jgi:cytochrome b
MTVLGANARAGGLEPSATGAAEGPADDGRTVRVWDPLVRIFHWSLLAAVITAWVTADEVQAVHEVVGYGIAGLLAVRIVWGFIGSTHARFSDFVYRPSAVAAHLVATARLSARRYLGHNPAGGAMIIALLAMLALTCATGIAMTTEVYADVHWVEEIHEAIVNGLFVLVGLHVVGVLVASLEHRENLVRAMITGRKRRDLDVGVGPR